MNPLAALVPDWAKKKKAVQDGKPVDLPAGVSLPEGMKPMPSMNRAMRRSLMKQLKRFKK